MKALEPTLIGGRPFLWGQRTYIMGVINVTPDSFAGDGLGYDLEGALARARQMAAAGADILDVGGESTRPGADPVSEEEELRRVLPVIRALAQELPLPISIDTYKAPVAEAALRAGAQMVNDTWGFRQDPAMARLVARYGVAAVVMHNQRGRPGTEVMADILAGLRESLAIAGRAGVAEEQLLVDPGFGFGWSVAQNLELLRRLSELKALGRPILVGTSRKSTIGHVLGLPAEERLEGTAATVAIAIAHGADVVRVHDVTAMARVCRMTDAILRGWREDLGMEGR